MRRRSWGAAMLLLCGGCYGYYPLDRGVSPGREVQLTLTDSGSVVLAREIGPSADALSGKLTADSSGAFVIAVDGVQRRDGNTVNWKGEHVAVPHVLAARLEERRFSRARTVLFGGALAAALIGIRQAFQGNGAGFGSGLPGTGTTK